jgi:hypothetical protein
MARISIPTQPDVPEASRPLLEQIERRFGFVPNVFRLVSVSPRL